MGNDSTARTRLDGLYRRAENGLDWFADNAFDHKWLERLGGYTATTFHPRFSLRVAGRQPHQHPLVCVFGISSEKYSLLRNNEQRRKWRDMLASPQSDVVDDYQHILNVFEIGDERARHLGFIPPLEMGSGWDFLHKAWVNALRIQLYHPRG